MKIILSTYCHFLFLMILISQTGGKKHHYKSSPKKNVEVYYKFRTLGNYKSDRDLFFN